MDDGLRKGRYSGWEQQEAPGQCPSAGWYWYSYVPPAVLPNLTEHAHHIVTADRVGCVIPNPRLMDGEELRVRQLAEQPHG